MLKQEVSIGDNSKTKWARLCDSCHLVPCTIYCRVDGAYLCTACDTRIHQLGLGSGHERVWVCEACERAPAAFVCKADAASLCASCDADIHSPNPLASRHIRVPILPVGSVSCVYGSDPLDGGDEDDQTIMDEEGDEDEAAISWLLLNNPGKNSISTNQANVHTSNGYPLQGKEVDQLLGLFDFNSGVENHFYAHQQEEFCAPEKNCAGDSVVPVHVQCGEAKDSHHHLQSFLFGMDFDTKSGYDFNRPSIPHSVSVSSLDVGVVPESTISYPMPPKGTIDLFSGPPVQMPTQLSPLDREARVMRYREKKKTRKFEKTIRYASRKAYAETRPRIKGRFAKRSDVESEMDQMFSSNSLIAESGYGIVPSL